MAGSAGEGTRDHDDDDFCSLTGAKLEGLREENNALKDENKKLNSTMNALKDENKKLNATIRALTKEAFGPQRSPPLPASKPQKINDLCIVTLPDILSAGLAYAGFDMRRQQRCNLKRNTRRFKAFFGAPPSSVLPMFMDLRAENQDVRLRDILLGMNWLYCYEVYEVLSGRWGPNENEIGTTAIKAAKMIQAMRSKKIKFEFDEDDGEILLSYDTVSFRVNEFRLEPSAKNYDHKSHSCGLVSETGS